MKVLFVCTGNTCRSCMSEAIFNSLKEEDSITAFSAGEIGRASCRERV